MSKEICSWKAVVLKGMHSTEPSGRSLDTLVNVHRIILNASIKKRKHVGLLFLWKWF